MDDVEKLVRQSVRTGTPVAIKYFPSITTRTLMGWRYIAPLSVYNYKGNKYLLAWFVDGSSVAGNTGYRLYLFNNVNEAKTLDNMVSVVPPRETKEVNLNLVAYKMAVRGQVE